MNIENIKKDMDSGTLIKKVTLEKLVEAALIYEKALLNSLAKEPDGGTDMITEAYKALYQVREL